MGDSVMNGLAAWVRGVGVRAPDRPSLVHSRHCRLPAPDHGELLDRLGFATVERDHGTAGPGRPVQRLARDGGRLQRPEHGIGGTRVSDRRHRRGDSPYRHHGCDLAHVPSGSPGNVARFRANNAVLRAKAAEYPDLRIADWNARSAGLPHSWFSDDGIHLGGPLRLRWAEVDRRCARRCATCQGCCGALQNCGPVTSPAGHFRRCPLSGGVHLLETPVRLLDTRDRIGKVGPQRVAVIPVAGTNGVPPDATAAIVSVIDVEPCADNFLTMYPCGTAPPLASVVNTRVGRIVANSAIVVLGSGNLCAYTAQPTDVVVDLTGFIGPGGASTTSVAPRRIVDTCAGESQLVSVPQQRLAVGQGLTVDVRALPGVDETVRALGINLTAAQPTAAGFLSTLPGPCTGAVPATSSLNVAPGLDVSRDGRGERRSVLRVQQRRNRPRHRPPSRARRGWLSVAAHHADAIARHPRIPEHWLRET